MQLLPWNLQGLLAAFGFLASLGVSLGYSHAHNKQHKWSSCNVQAVLGNQVHIPGASNYRQTRCIFKARGGVRQLEHPSSGSPAVQACSRLPLL
eukprot:1142354-Pelagomonas_calceolata.AAC.3